MSDSGKELIIWVADCLQVPVEKLRLFEVERDGNEVTLIDWAVPQEPASTSAKHETASAERM
jgi:hypothetical protein